VLKLLNKNLSVANVLQSHSIFLLSLTTLVQLVIKCKILIQKVARVLADLLTGFSVTNGAVYDIKKRIRKLPEIEPSVSEVFWNETFQKIMPYLR